VLVWRLLEVSRLVKAFSAYAILGVLEWFTLGDEKLTLAGGSFITTPRSLALTILVVLAVLTLLAEWRQRMRARLGRNERE
jgi:hypothetical protein